MGMEWDFNLNFGDLSARIEGTKTGVAMTAMEAIMRPEVARQTPVETGALVGSEEVRPIPSGAEVFIPGPYARRQHFGLDYHHNVGNALFLELPMVAKAQDVIDFVGDEIGKAF